MMKIAINRASMVVNMCGRKILANGRGRPFFIDGYAEAIYLFKIGL